MLRRVRGRVRITCQSARNFDPYCPKEVSGRANAALGVLNMGAAYCLQSLSGFIIALWPADGGPYPAVAHQAALATGLGLQLISLGFFLAPARRLQPVPMARAVGRTFGFCRNTVALDPPARLLVVDPPGRDRAQTESCVAVCCRCLCCAVCRARRHSLNSDQSPRHKTSCHRAVPARWTP
jgi:hypothetical protein